MARKRIDVFNLSFLDIMSCGFGAVILFYMIISAQVSERADTANEDLLSETLLLEEEVLEGRKNLVRLRNSVESRQEQDVIAEGEIRRMRELVEQLTLELAEYDGDSLATRDSVEQLKADVKSLEEAKKRLSAEASESANEPGSSLRSFTGQGNRQYLTGMRMGGKHVLILVDASSSMLGRTYVNVIRYRNMASEKKRRSPKWRSVLRTVDWITTQLSPAAEFQVLVFNQDVKSVFPGSGLDWQKVGNGERVTEAIDLLREVTPDHGTSLYQAFQAAADMTPPPDNIYLLTDGLPTQGVKPPNKTTMVRPEQRVRLFTDAMKRLPRNSPVNVLLYPMDGDPDAAGYLWQLAIETSGSMMSPSLDWP
ncbi:MAG: VWA domain-containing protein [Gammaproteobacteria bacterium]|nr:VWA domain-containing protein [Gammaproteobacteria bacterium]